MNNDNIDIKPIAFYLPQFHPISENNEWWGTGFTEWTNVTKAKPLYKGHDQPFLPSDLGFYDLRIPEVRELQAQLAKESGLHGFAYWHYWFGNGKRILEHPFNEVIKSGKPDFPFCLAWANQTWTGHWHGNDKSVLVEQKYGGKEDYKAHFEALLPAFKDSRYIKIDNKPLFIVYNPWDIPNPKEFTDYWRELAEENGLAGFYFISIDGHRNTEKYGMDGSTWHEPVSHLGIKYSKLEKFKRKLNGKHKNPLRIEYADYINTILNKPLATNQFPVIMPNWDNTPRSGANGLVYENSTPELFKQGMIKAIDSLSNKAPSQKLIFIKSWNEWAEGNVLEPSIAWGNKYLEVLKELIVG